MSTPTLLAQSQILAYRCVKMTTTPGFVAPATSSTDAILGVTTKAVTATNGVVTLQENENGLVLLTAGGTIAAGDYLVPTTNGSVITASIGAFIATETAASGETLWAKMAGSSTGINSGPRVYGSTTPSKFIKDLASGADSVDFVVVGDSNTGSAVAGMWGYHNGLQQTLNDKGFTCYGTSVFPIITEMGGTGLRSSFAGGWRCGATLYKPWNGTPGSGQGYEPVRSGNDLQAQTDAPLYYNQWSPVGYTDITAATPIYLRYGSSSPDPTGTGSLGPNIESWVFLSANSTKFFNSYGMGIQEHHPLAQAGIPLFYRLKYGKFLNATNTTVSPVQDGGFCPIVFKTSGSVNGGGTEITTRKFVSSAAASAAEVGQVFVDETTWTTANYTGYRAGWSYVGSGGQGTCGPAALHCQSMYAKRKGWAVTSLSYLGGYNSESIAGVLAGVKNTCLKSLLKEIRERQISAGGSGRVVIVAQSGVNSYPASPGPNYETATRWTNAYTSMWSTFKEVWTSLGYPLSDLAIVCWVSHPISAADGSSGSSDPSNLVAVRAAAAQMAINNPDMTVADIKNMIGYNQLVRGSGNGQSFFQYWKNTPVVAPDFPAHLAGGSVSSGTEEFSGNATFVDGSGNPGLTLTGSYASAGTIANQYRYNELEITQVGYIDQGTIPSVQCTGTAGQFSCGTFQTIAVANRTVVVTGTLTGTATISGYSNPSTYYILSGSTTTSFQLSATRGGSPITTTAGTTTGLTFKNGVENYQPQRAFITEYDASTKFAKVAAWPGGTPASNGGGITPIANISAAADKNTKYKINTVHPADGYSEYMNAVISSLLI